MKKIVPLKNESDKMAGIDKMDGDDTSKKDKSYKAIMLSHKGEKK